MLRTLPPPLLLLSVVALASCDRSSEFEDCTTPADPTTGRRANQCPRSLFPGENTTARAVFGRVRSDELLVAGARVRVDRTAGGSSNSALPLTTMTDDVGFFSGLRAAPSWYDLSAQFDRTLIVYRDVAARYIEPSVETGSRTIGRAWKAHVDVTFDRPIPDGHSVAYFASGDGVYGVTGDTQQGLSVLIDKYSAPAMLHAVEYETAGGIETAKAFSHLTVLVDVNEPRYATFTLSPVTVALTPKFTGKLPTGFSTAVVDVILSFSPTSDVRLVRVPFDVVSSFPLVEAVGYTYRATATGPDGAVSDTGEVGFTGDVAEVPIEFPEPPSAVSPVAGEARRVGETLAASGEGVFEHVLVPQGSGDTIRIVTRGPDAVLPDVVMLGGAPSVGAYTWTVQAFPKARAVEELAGLRPRRYRPQASSAPRTIVLR